MSPRRTGIVDAVVVGEFVGTKQHKRHLTIWVEGKDNGEPTVAGAALDAAGVRLLIRRLTSQLNQMEGSVPRKVGCPARGCTECGYETPRCRP